MSKHTLRDIAHDVQRDNPHLGNKADVEAMARALFEVIVERTAKGGVVAVRGFGTFEAKVFKGRTLNSPLMKGGKVSFPDALVLRFRQSPAAKKMINEIAENIGKDSKKAKKADAKPADKPAKKTAKKATKKGKAAKKPAKAKEAEDEAEAEDDEDEA